MTTRNVGLTEHQEVFIGDLVRSDRASILNASQSAANVACRAPTLLASAKTR